MEEPQVDLPELSDLDIPDYPILNFVNSHCHSSEDLDKALQTYQAYQVPLSQDSTPSPERIFNHHIAQASQATYGSLVDRGANGGLAGLDVRILSRSSKKCTVTGIHSHDDRSVQVGGNRGFSPLMVAPCPWCLEVALCTFLSWENHQMRMLRGTQLCTLWNHMHGILLSWNIVTIW